MSVQGMTLVWWVCNAWHLSDDCTVLTSVSLRLATAGECRLVPDIVQTYFWPDWHSSSLVDDNSWHYTVTAVAGD